MESISRPLPVYLYLLWIFAFPTIIGFATQNILAFWVFVVIMAVSYFLYARNFYYVYKDSQNLYAKNPTNLFSKKYIIPLSCIESYQTFTSRHRIGIFIRTKNKETIFIPCYKLHKTV